jgi:hypothetical protein
MPDWRCAAARDLPINTERSWDGGAAKSRIFDWAGGDGDAVGAKARRGFLAYDADAADAKGSYKLPFADVIDGTLTALQSGLNAAASRLPGTDISDDCKSKARDVLDAYQAKIHDESATEEERAAGGILLARAPLLDAAQQRARQPKDKDELAPELLAQIHDPSVLDGGLPYLNAAWGSTDLVDTYFTRMLPSTLQNFADDASGGVSIQNSHRTNELGLGRTYLGKYTAARSANPGRAVMDFYIPPNLRVTEVNTSDVIGGIRWGTIKDVSVGFYGGSIRCSLCRKPMLEDLFFLFFFGGEDDDRDVVDPDAPCGHLPGVEYPVRDREGKKTDQRAVAIGEIDDARLAELSFVFDGATPQAQIKGRQAPVVAKAQRMLELGVLTRAAALQLEHRYRGRNVRFPDLTTRRYALRAPTTTGGRPAEDAAHDDQDDQDAPKEDAAMPGPNDGAPADAGATTTTPPPPAGGGGAAGGPGGGTAATSANPSPPSAAQAGQPAPPVQADPLVAVRAALVRSGLAPDGFDGDAAAIAVRFGELGRELTDLREWADVGRAAREQLVDDCKKAGIRAFGASGFSESAYGPILTRGSYQELQALKTHFDGIGDRRFPGGRKTEDGSAASGARPSEPMRVPDIAYRSA